MRVVGSWSSARPRPEQATATISELNMSSSGIIGLDTGPGGSLLRSLGLTHDAFIAQLNDECGHAPPGAIPLTPRALRIVALAGRCTEGPVGGIHLLYGVVEESDEWREAWRPGPHHLRVACEALDVRWSDFRQQVEAQLRSA
jgi:hypothetical protein